MAGMRIGFACGNEKLIRFLNDVKYSFNSYTMDRTAIAAGVAAVEDKAYFDETGNKIIIFFQCFSERMFPNSAVVRIICLCQNTSFLAQ